MKIQEALMKGERTQEAQVSRGSGSKKRDLKILLRIGTCCEICLLGESKE